MYILKIKEPNKPPQIRQFIGELTEEERAKWRRIMKFSNCDWEVIPGIEIELKGGKNGRDSGKNDLSNLRRA